MEIRIRGYGKSYKAGYEMCLQGIREHYKKLNITDVEPWSTYKISGSWLFELERILDAKNVL